MLHLKNAKNQEFLSELTAQESANMNGGQNSQGQQTQGQQTGFNQQKYVQALGIAYLSPPGYGKVTKEEALLAQKIAWED